MLTAHSRLAAGSLSDAFPGTVTVQKFPNRCSGAQFMRVPDLRFSPVRGFWPDCEAKIGIFQWRLWGKRGPTGDIRLWAVLF